MHHEYFMKEALKEAHRAAEEGDVPVGAVVVFQNKIIGKAHNQVERLNDPTAHAEMLAITQAASVISREQLEEARLYVTLEPCNMCAGALVLARIKEIFYAAPDPKTGACGSMYDIVHDHRLNHQIKVVHGLLREEAEELLKEFFSRLRK